MGPKAPDLDNVVIVIMRSLKVDGKSMSKITDEIEAGDVRQGEYMQREVK